MKKLWQIVLPVLLAVSWAQALKIVAVTPTGRGAECPREVKVRGEFTVAVPGPITYRFLYSDGRKSPKYRRIFAPGRHTVETRRTFRHDFNGWVRLKISSPVQKRVSPPKHFRIRCRESGSGTQGGGGATVTAVTLNAPPPASLRCPTDYVTRGRIRTDGPVTVRYRFRRADGVTTPVRTVRFRQAGNHAVRHTWRIRRSLDTRVRLEVLGPVRKNSAYVPMKIRCRRGEGGESGVGVVRDVTIRTLPPAATHCPARVTTRGSFRHAPMTRVKFRFVRADGAASPWVTRDFNQAGTYRPRYTWRIDHSIDTRVRLQVKARPRLALRNVGWEEYRSSWTRLRVRCQANPSDLLGAITLHATPAQYEGTCPKKIRFHGSIRFRHAGTIRYRFIRSDGAKGPVRTLHADGPTTRLVSHEWTLGTDYPDGWVRIKILNPVVRYSPKAHFSLRCLHAATVTDAYIQLAPDHYRGSCPVTLDIQGRFRVDGPATVRYRFLRSDGTRTPVRIRQVNRAGTYDVWDSWTVGATTHGWERLEILSPNHRLSRRARFSIRCETPGHHSGNRGHDDRDDWMSLLPPLLLGTLGVAVLGDQSQGQGNVVTVVDESSPSTGSGSQSDTTGDTAAERNREAVIPETPSAQREENRSLPGPEVVAEDRDGDGLSDTLEAELLDRFRPLYLFSEGERYLPSDPLYQLAHATILSAPLEEGTPALLRPRALERCGEIDRNLSVILGCTTPPADLLQTSLPVAVAADLNDSLRRDPGEGNIGGWDAAVASAAGLYGHVVPDGPLVKVEYWQYFPFSESNATAAEGDWQLLELWVDPQAKSLRKICHRFHHRKACFEMANARRVFLDDGLSEYRGAEYNRTLPPLDPASAERLPAAYQNRAVRFLERDGAMHPAVYIERGSHDFWPTPEGVWPGAADHNGTGHRYVSTLRGGEGNLGEVSRPLPSPRGDYGVLLRYSGHWGAWHTPRALPAHGPALHCDWTFPPAESSLRESLAEKCYY